MKALLTHPVGQPHTLVLPHDQQSVPTILGRLALEVAMYGGLAAAILAAAGSMI
jgi:hypothetical protein